MSERTLNEDIARAALERPDASAIIVAAEEFDSVERDERGQVNGVPVLPSRCERRYSGTWIFWQDWEGPCIECVRP